MTGRSVGVAYSYSSSDKVLLENDATLQKILLRLRENTSTHTFLPCLLVCKKWYSLAMVVLQAAVVLRNQSLSGFLKSTRLPLSSKSYAIQSLSLLLDVAAGDPRSTTATTWPLGCLLKDLSKIIAGDMQALRIFSLRVDHQPVGALDLGSDVDIDRITAEPGFPASALVALIASLPVTCNDLEIDTSGFETYADGEHLCPQIARMLPGLTHFRLRIRQLCPCFIDLPAQSSCPECQGGLQVPLCPKLRSLVINMELSSVIQGGVTRCSQLPQTRPAEKRIGHAEDDLQVELSHHLLIGLMRKNCFPLAERIEIHATINLNTIPWHHVRQADIRNCKTHVSSFLPLPSYIQGVWKRGTHRCMRPVTTSKGTGGVIISPWWPHPRELTENAWVSNFEGVSLPTTLFPHTLSVFDTDDYHLFPYQREKAEDNCQIQIPSPTYHRSLSAYAKEMKRRWRENGTGNTAQSQAQTQTQTQTQTRSHPIYEELSGMVGVDYESSLRTQTYHTLRQIPHELFPFPDPVPMEWYRRQTPLGHADVWSVGEGCGYCGHLGHFP
ncbi:conserved hypothetical protein [Histoplasma capsulatum G186AR]|uniref:F-box domain-containing protein n=2 Tax=Ajellomyces capsulatus TaxID=5037 RepID=C0NTQ6_AJECG|nr:uncharacterized protein HCBG_06536 [Histoplasma capsulatum G186AR]EEH05417.1 conserved hypothetical protein [Histoplasma capsulatum G186AR]